jgi:subfamily B ATP-binding cassette protein HlyB/CyaB
MIASENLSGQDFLWVLRSLCQLYRIPFSPVLLQQQFPPPYERTTILEAAKALEFKVVEKTVSAKELSALSLPCLVFLRHAPAEPGVLPAADAAAEPAAARSKPALLVKANDTELLYFEAGTNTSLTLPMAEFESRLEPGIMLFTRLSAEADGQDMLAANQTSGSR